MLDFSEAEMMGWQWCQLNNMQTICTSLQTYNHASTLSLFYMGRMLFLKFPVTQPTASKHRRHWVCWHRR